MAYFGGLELWMSFEWLSAAWSPLTNVTHYVPVTSKLAFPDLMPPVLLTVPMVNLGTLGLLVLYICMPCLPKPFPMTRWHVPGTVLPQPHSMAVWYDG